MFLNDKSTANRQLVLSINLDASAGVAKQNTLDVPTLVDNSYSHQYVIYIFH